MHDRASGLMALKAECITVPVCALVFHEHFSDSIVQASSRYI